MRRNTHKTCTHCGDKANSANMGPDANGDLLCPDCFTDPEAVPDDAPEMPALSEIEIK